MQLKVVPFDCSSAFVINRGTLILGSYMRWNKATQTMKFIVWTISMYNAFIWSWAKTQLEAQLEKSNETKLRSSGQSPAVYRFLYKLSFKF